MSIIVRYADNQSQTNTDNPTILGALEDAASRAKCDPVMSALLQAVDQMLTTDAVAPFLHFTPALWPLVDQAFAYALPGRQVSIAYEGDVDEEEGLEPRSLDALMDKITDLVPDAHVNIGPEGEVAVMLHMVLRPELGDDAVLSMFGDWDYEDWA